MRDVGALARCDSFAEKVLRHVDTIKSLACLPLAYVARWSDARHLIEGDVAHWLAVFGAGSGEDVALERISVVTGAETPSGRGGGAGRGRGRGVPGLHRLLYAFPEFRGLYYHRLIGGNALGALASRFLAVFFKPAPGLTLLTQDIGPGLFLAHGIATVLAAEKIGSNCYIHQGVTVGWDYKSERKPIIGDGVFIGAGAVVLGAVTIGDHARIGANSVVLCDVPPWSTAVGAPARVLPLAGAVTTTQ